MECSVYICKVHLVQCVIQSSCSFDLSFAKSGVLSLLLLKYYYQYDYIFKKFLFIYLTEIETASERGNTSRGVGEEEAGS